MALESLLAAAFAAGTIEGASILSHHSISSDNLRTAQKSSVNMNSNWKSDKSSTNSSAKVVPSLMYGTIALPMSIIGASPGPAIIEYLSSLHSEKSSSTLTTNKNIKTNLFTDGYNSTKQKTLVPGKLPRSKKSDHVNNFPSNNGACLESPNDDVNSKSTAEASTVDENKTKKNGIQLNVTAVKRFRDDNKRAIQAMIEARNKQSSTPPSPPRQTIFQQKDKEERAYGQKDGNQYEKNISHFKIKSKTGNKDVPGDDEPRLESSNLYLHSKIQNLYSLIAFPTLKNDSHFPVTNNLNYSTLNANHPLISNITYSPPLAEAMRRFRALFFLTAVFGSIFTNYSISADLDDVSKDNIRARKQNESDQEGIKKSHLALRFVAENDANEILHLNETLLSGRQPSDTKIDQVSNMFQTFPIIIPKQPMQKQEFMRTSTLNEKGLKGSNKYLRLDHNLEKQWDQIVQEDWIVRPLSNSANKNNEKKSDESDFENTAMSPILLCEADISKSILTYLKYKELDPIGSPNDNGNREPRDDKLSLETVQVSTRILDWMVHKKYNDSTSESSLSQNQQECNVSDPSRRNDGIFDDSRIINVLIQTGAHSLPTVRDSNYIVVDSLTVVGSNICYQIEKTFTESISINEESDYSSPVVNQRKKVIETEKLDKNDKLNSLQRINQNSRFLGDSSIQNDERDHISSKLLPSVPMITHIGRSIRKGCATILSKSFSSPLYLPSKSQERIVYLFSDKDVSKWLQPFLKANGWKVVYFDLKDQISTVKKLPSNAYVFICGANDMATIEHLCGISSQMNEKKDDKSEPTTSDKVHIFTFFENPSSTGLLNMLFDHEKNSSVSLHVSCLKTIHNEVFENIRQSLISGVKVNEVREMINSSVIK